MRVTAAGVVADALRLFRRDRALLVALAGPFWFVPAYAVALLVPAPPPPVGTEGLTAAMENLRPWFAAQAPWYFTAWAIGLWGTATVYALYLHRDRPDLRAALGHGALLWPRLLLASALIALMAGAGLLLWVLPGLYLLGRFMPAGPALAAERPLSALHAIGHAFRLTRGSGMALGLVAAATLGLGWILGQPFLLLEAWVASQGGGGNPVAVAILGAGAAAVAAGAALASALLAVAAYLQLTRQGI